MRRKPKPDAYEFADPYWDRLSEEDQRLIKAILEMPVSKRRKVVRIAKIFRKYKDRTD